MAVKFLHSYRLEHRDLQAFLTEVAILHTCRHPCIVELKGAFLGEVSHPETAVVPSLLQVQGCNRPLSTHMTLCGFGRAGPRVCHVQH